jgi:hypothetical protein
MGPGSHHAAEALARGDCRDGPSGGNLPRFSGGGVDGGRRRRRFAQTTFPDLEQDQVHVWTRGGGIEVVTVTKPKERQKRHARKYAEGELGEDRSFYFRGPEAALNLRAQNLSTFLQMAAGVDDKTWLHHLRAGEYSRWFQRDIKDDDLASEAQAVENDNSLSARDSRVRIKDMIDRRYTAPSKAD